MGVDKPQSLLGAGGPPVSKRLDSWKDIATYLERDESTVRRWEKEGLPVHRHVHKSKASVYAYQSEVDVWWNDGRARLESVETATARRRRSAMYWAAAGLLVLLSAGLGLNVAGVRDRLLGRPLAGEVTAIAVLPLKNLSGDPGQEYFVDGMTEALITELGKISSLQVLSYQSVIGYRKTTKPLPQIARELKVDALLEGAALGSGHRIRITANLVQAVPERHLWAETYEFDPRDILTVQGEVARSVARQIRVRLTPQEQVRLTNSRAVDPEAYKVYLLGRAYSTKAQTPTNWMKAKEYFEKAIEKDPGYAPAYASLAEHYMRAGQWALTRNPSDARLQARQWAEKALKLDDTLAEAHNALARVKQGEWDWAGADREYRRAIELNPNYPGARIWYAMYLYAMQRFDEAVAQAQRAQQLDPASPLINTWAGAAYFYAGRLEEATASIQKALELDPSYSDASWVLARHYLTLGMNQQAIVELQKALIFNKKEPFVLGTLAHAYARAGQREEAQKLVGELKRIVAEREYVPAFSLIYAYAGLGDKEQAFAWLERSYQEHKPKMVWLNVDPLLDPLRPDPRFHDLVRRMGLPAKSQ